MVTILFLAAVALLFLLGRLYSARLARGMGEDPARSTPSVTMSDGRDYVPTPTGVVFAHHFASIAGAGPILGPVIALAYGWLPAFLWLFVGGLLFGAVHDFGALYVSMREGGRSLATVARRYLGRPAFAMMIAFTVIMLVFVTASFLSISATALTSSLPADDLGLGEGQRLFREKIVDGKRMAVIGGVASTSVIVITCLAPLMGWLYVKRGTAVWKCSLLALAIAVLSVLLGLRFPVTMGETPWKLVLSAYVLVAAGAPVWLLLQPRDFVNVHFLYAGLALLVAVVVGLGCAGSSFQYPALHLAEGSGRHGPVWPMLFVLVACGAISGFHALCAGGTTSKQIKTEPDARRVGYYAMLLETVLALGVLCVAACGLAPAKYASIMFAPKENPALAFAWGLGASTEAAFGVSKAWGALFAMLILEGFVVTTLDTAVRLNRYLLEELWATLFGQVPRVLRHYWVNSAIAAGAMFLVSSQGTVLQIWKIFGSGNQLLAAMGLFTVAVWLAARGRPWLFAALPAAFMVATTAFAMIRAFFVSYLGKNAVLAVSDVAVLLLGGAVVVIAAARLAGRGRSGSVAPEDNPPGKENPCPPR